MNSTQFTCGALQPGRTCVVNVREVYNNTAQVNIDIIAKQPKLVESR